MFIIIQSVMEKLFALSETDNPGAGKATGAGFFCWHGATPLVGLQSKILPDQFL
jgi:hypothetical protein